MVPRVDVNNRIVILECGSAAAMNMLQPGIKATLAKLKLFFFLLDTRNEMLETFAGTFADACGWAISQIFV